MKGSSERWPKRWPNNDHFVSFWVLTDTSPQRAQNGCLAGKKIFYSFSLLLLLLVLLLLLLFFQSLAHFMSTNTKPSGTIGDTQKTMTISATSFRGCKRFSPLLTCLWPWIGGATGAWGGGQSMPQVNAPESGCISVRFWKHADNQNGEQKSYT